MTKEIAIHNLFALKLRSRVTSDREALDMAIKALEQTRPNGKWIGEESLDGSIRYMCDNCKEFEYVDYYNFCPNCGADMRESDE